MTLTLGTVSDFFTSALISSQKQLNHIDKEVNQNGGTIGTHIALLCEAISTNIDTRTCFNLEQFLIQLTAISAQTLQQLASPILECVHQLLQNLNMSYKNEVQSTELKDYNFRVEMHKFISALKSSLQVVKEFDILTIRKPQSTTPCDDNLENEDCRKYLLDVKRSFLNGLMVICEAWYEETSPDLEVLDIVAKMAEKLETIAANKTCRNENAPNHAVNQVFATFLRSVLEGMKVTQSYEGVTKDATSDSSDDVIEILD